ncbi:MAG: hypothetical protein JSS59_01565 [Proteobacteria bacterium]|uniref:hypothetical protein n=1 Tax=Rudaea sp. TaxID=2136325 RepID=UPI00378365C1|nr:hypothetical protein [Pseudomonadota bacterium]
MIAFPFVDERQRIRGTRHGELGTYARRRCSDFVIDADRFSFIWHIRCDSRSLLRQARKLPRNGV